MNNQKQNVSKLSKITVKPGCIETQRKQKLVRYSRVSLYPNISNQIKGKWKAVQFSRDSLYPIFLLTGLSIYTGESEAQGPT